MIRKNIIAFGIIRDPHACVLKIAFLDSPDFCEKLHRVFCFIKQHFFVHGKKKLIHTVKRVNTFLNVNTYTLVGDCTNCKITRMRKIEKYVIFVREERLAEFADNKFGRRFSILVFHSCNKQHISRRTAFFICNIPVSVHSAQPFVRNKISAIIKLRLGHIAYLIHNIHHDSHPIHHFRQNYYRACKQEL